MRIKAHILFLFIFLSAISFGQSTDLTENSLQTDTNVVSNHEPDDSFYKAGLATMAMFFMIGFFILVIVGIALAIIFLVIFAGLVMSGIISTSIVVGLYKRSFQKGFKVFVVMTCMFLGSILATVLFVILNKILLWFIVDVAIAAGLVLGAVGGLVIGLIFFRLLKGVMNKLTSWLQERKVMAPGDGR